jgi:hypothetical protein
VLINYGIRILSGTGIAEYLGNSGHINTKELLRPVFFLSKHFRKHEWETIMKNTGKHNGWAVFNRIDSFIIRKSINSVKYILPSPQWKYAGIMSVFLKPLRKILSVFISEYKYHDITANCIRD